jgi:hypothetical protein
MEPFVNSRALFGLHGPTVPAGIAVDMLHAKLSTMRPGNFPVTHRFTPGLYIRQIFMPKGSLIISKIHRTEHPFVISQGHAAVWSEAAGVVHLRAPFTGITYPGTRRVLYIHEDCIWTTFHPTSKTDLGEIEEEIIEPHDPTATLDEATLKRLQAEPKEES